jgi:hypothetical protein
MLKGSISGETYTSEGGGFSVRTPFKPGDSRFRAMQVKELDVPLGKYVSFGPSGDDPRFYRVEVATQNPPQQISADIMSHAVQAFQSGIDQIQSAYQRTLRKIEMREDIIGGHKAVFALYEQDIPPGHREHGRHLENIIFHCMYLIDYQTHAAMCWIETPYRGDMPWSEARAYFKQYDFDEARDFAASVRILTP